MRTTTTGQTATGRATTGRATNGQTSPSTGTVAGDRYRRPDPFTRRVLNPIVAGLARLGLSIRGSRVLEVAGRSSGEWRSVPVNPLQLDGHRYLVAPRGTTDWVRNLNAAGSGRLRRGRRIETFDAVAVADDDKLPILRAYLDKWGFEVGKFFEGITVDSSDAELAAIAPGFPVFEITPATPSPT